MKTKIPDRWLEYSPMGSKVAGTRFIAFKAPLSKEICTKMKATERFTPDILMERCPNMRLIIDLTNTDRYYNKQEFIDRGIQYEKIMCPGQVIPPQSLIFRFFEIIDDFYLKNGLKDVLIGIHCTHGVNRTGYFIGRYMVQRMGFHFEKAIPCIEEARGHKIERTNYIKDLMVQVPIPSSLSSSGGKKIIENKVDPKKLMGSGGKVIGKVNIERTPEKQFTRKSLPEVREPPNRRTPSPNFRPREPPVRPGNYAPSSGRPFSPVRRGVSPVRRGLSPVRRGFSPGRRPPSPPGRRGMKAPSPKRFRTPPRSFSPPRRRSPPRRSPPRRLSPPRREGDFGPSSFRDGEDRDFNRGPGGPNRGYSPPRRPESHSRRMDSPPRQIDFPPRGPPERQNYGHPSSGSFQPPFERERGFNGPPSKYGPPVNNFSDSRPPDRHHPWDNRSNNQSSFNEPRSSHPGGPGSSQWNQPSNNFAGPSPNFNAPPPSFESRQGGYHPPSSGRFNDRRFDEPKFPPSREETRRPWNDKPPNSGPPFNSDRYEDNRNFSDRGKDYHGKPVDKPYRSPPRGEYSREKRPPSPFRDSRRDMGSPANRHGPGFEPERPSWDNRRRSPDASFGEYSRDGGRRRSRSPGRRPSPPVRRRSRSPVRRSPPRFSGVDGRRTPTRNRPSDGPPRPFTPPFFDGPPPPPRSGPEPPYQQKRYYESKEDCRDLLNQKRHFDGSDRSSDMFNEPKPGKLDLRDIPKEVDLRKVIRGGVNEPPLKDRLGPHPRDERSGPPPRDDRSCPPPRDDRFGPNSRDDRFGPLVREDRFGPPQREDRFGPSPREDRFGPPPVREEPMDAGRRFGRGRSRSPRGRSPHRYGAPLPPRRF